MLVAAFAGSFTSATSVKGSLNMPALCDDKGGPVQLKLSSVG